jgi:UDPglucose 6-dehydrogenase
MNNIGIVGNGFVGNAIYQNIKNFYNVKVYDIDKNKSYNTLEQALDTDICFVCLPTPMTHTEGGECNLDIINQFFINLPKNLNTLFAIKSTIPIGTTRNLKSTRPDLKIVHNPEFLTAKNSVEDFKNSDRNIIGGQDAESLLLFYNKLFPNSNNLIVSSDESETIKYFANTYLATKVTFFNLMFDVCEKYRINYENVVNGVCSDKRIGFSHSKVPGPDGDRGFGGTCFPKDINSLIDTLDNNELNSSILKEIWNYNKIIRKDWDWTNNQSAVLNKE